MPRMLVSFFMSKSYRALTNCCIVSNAFLKYVSTLSISVIVVVVWHSVDATAGGKSVLILLISPINEGLIFEKNPNTEEEGAMLACILNVSSYKSY